MKLSDKKVIGSIFWVIDCEGKPREVCLLYRAFANPSATVQYVDQGTGLKLRMEVSYDEPVYATEKAAYAGLAKIIRGKIRNWQRRLEKVEAKLSTMEKK